MNNPNTKDIMIKILAMLGIAIVVLVGGNFLMLALDNMQNHNETTAVAYVENLGYVVLENVAAIVAYLESLSYTVFDPDVTDYDEQVLLEKGRAHETAYYDGYVYVGLRNANYPRLYKVDADDYTNNSYLNAANSSIGDMCLQGSYLWLASHDGYVHKVDTSSFSVNASYDIDSSNKYLDSICSDNETVFAGQYLKSTGRLGSIDIATGSINTNNTGQHYWHSLCVDSAYLYGADTHEDKLYRINKTTLALIESVSLGNFTDDITQTLDYIYCGTENVGQDYLYRVDKHDFSNTDNYTNADMGSCNGVYIIDGQVIYVDKTNCQLWVFSPDLTLKKTISLSGTYYNRIDELLDDGNGYFHVTEWRDAYEEFSPLLRYEKSDLWWYWD